MRFTKIVKTNCENAKIKLEVINRALSNSSMTADEIKNTIEKIIELIDTNIEFLDREISEQ